MMPTQTNDAVSDTMTFEISDLKIDTTLKYLINALQKCGPLVRVNIHRNKFGLCNGCATCSFKKTRPMHEIKHKLVGLFDGCIIKVKSPNEPEVAQKQGSNVIHRTLNRFAPMYLQKIIRHARKRVLHRAVSTRKLLIDNPHLALAILYAIQRVKPSVFHLGAVPKEAYIAINENIKELSRKRESEGHYNIQLLGRGGVLSKELVNMIHSMSPQQLQKVTSLTARELQVMPVAQRHHMENIQRYILDKHMNM